MGQYYIPIDLDTKQWIYPHDYNSGLKLMEHSWVPNPFVNAVGELLLKDHDWHKTKLIWAGDYTKEDDFPIQKDYADDIKQCKKKLLETDSDFSLDNNIDIYCLAETIYQKIMPEEKKWNVETAIRFYFNETKKEYFDIQDTISIEGWRVHPLPLLTCTCNHSGGSYYYNDEQEEEEKEYIGRWKGDVIFSAKSLKDVENYRQYKLIKPPFYKQYVI